MKPATLLAELRSRGIEVSLRGDDIAYRGPKGAMTDGLLDQFREQKQAIVAELQSFSRSEEASLDFLISLVELELATGEELEHDFAKLVEPLKSRLLGRVGLDVEFTRGTGCWLFDADGNKYLDCIAQYGGLPFGYNPTNIWDALQAVQDQQLPNVATQTLLGSAGELARRILDLLPSEFEHVVFCNSGAEATEVAIKLVRAAKDRPGILSAKKGFHGLTTGALSATGSESFQNGFYVRCQDFQHVPFGDAQALEQRLLLNAEHFAAFVVEPVQGEAGILIPPEDYLRQVREICDRFGVLLVLDEVQTGLGRTGAMFAFERAGIVPDVITLAKALGGGLMPTGAVVARPEAYSTRFGLRHSSTFAGNTMASRAGIATIEALLENKRQLIQSVGSHGQFLLEGLKKIQAKYPELVCDVRGVGFMLAIEFDFEPLKHRKGILPILVEQQMLLHLIISHLLHCHGIRVAPTFMGRNVIRLEPPLIFEREHCDLLLDGLEKTIAKIVSGQTAELVSIMIGIAPGEIADRTSDVSGQVKVLSQQPAEREYGLQNSQAAKVVGEFGFLVHLSSLEDLVQFDPSLSVLNDDELADLKHQFTRSAEPAVLGVTEFGSLTNSVARGHFVLVPFTPQELLDLPPELAIEKVAQAATAAAKLNVGVIGLGGFTSIVTTGGLALDGTKLPPITSGNAFTVASSIESIEVACTRNGVDLSDSTVAIVGAAGQIGRAVSILMSESTRKLILVGRDGRESRTRKSLQGVADEIANHSRASAEQVVVASSIEEIRSAGIVVAASSSPEAIIESEHIGRSAIVCDASRPANVSISVKESRQDVTWIEGGLIGIPGCHDLDLFAGPREDAAYACVAEAALWTLEPSLGKPSAVQLLDVEQIQLFRSVAKRHGFEVLV